MASYEKPFATDAPQPVSYVPAPSQPASQRPSVAARRTVAPTGNLGAVLDVSASENRPCSIDDRADDTMPGRRMW